MPRAHSRNRTSSGASGFDARTSLVERHCRRVVRCVVLISASCQRRRLGEESGRPPAAEARPGALCVVDPFQLELRQGGQVRRVYPLSGVFASAEGLM